MRPLRQQINHERLELSGELCKSDKDKSVLIMTSKTNAFLNKGLARRLISAQILTKQIHFPVVQPIKTTNFRIHILKQKENLSGKITLMRISEVGRTRGHTVMKIRRLINSRHI